MCTLGSPAEHKCIGYMVCALHTEHHLSCFDEKTAEPLSLHLQKHN